MLLFFAFLLAAREATDDTKRACCTFAQRWCEIAYGKTTCDAAPNALWNLHADTKDPWGPVTACERAGLGTAATHLNVPGVFRVQGWRGKPFDAGVSGHTFTVVVPSAGCDTVMILDSAAKDRAGNVRGPKVQIVSWLEYSKQFVGGMAACLLRATP